MKNNAITLDGYFEEWQKVHNESFVVALQVFMVGTRPHVEAVDPCPRHEFDEVFVALVVLCEHDEVPSALVVVLFAAVALLASCHVHLAPEDRLEQGKSLCLPLTVHLVAIVEQFFHTEHISMVGDGNATHAVGNGLVYQFLNARLSIEYGVVCMNV